MCIKRVGPPLVFKRHWQLFGKPALKASIPPDTVSVKPRRQGSHA